MNMKEVKQKDRTLCFHCGEQCLDESLRYDEKDFCCPGCMLVYEVLNENGLSSYYEYGEKPGIKNDNNNKSANRFDYLEEPEVIQKLIDFQNEKETHISFDIPAIHCASCVWLLENLHRLNSNIFESRVDYVKKEVHIKFVHNALSLKELVRLLAKIGYEPSIQLDALEEKPKRRIDRKLIYKLAVAGFCFGNMMFFSLPEYFSEVSLLEENFRGLFVQLNLALSLPVIFYSATDYYRSAWYSLSSGRVNMDVPIVMGIISLFVYSLYEVIELGESGYFDSIGGLLFFLLIGKYFQQKTYDRLAFDRDYKSYFPLAVTRLGNKGEEVVSLPKIKVGDTLKIRHGELIPADSLLLEGEARIDYSFVTGEEVPVFVKKGSLIYAGGRQQAGALLLNVQKAPSQGYLTDLWNQDSFQLGKPKELESLANAISGKFTLVVLMVAFGALAFWIQTDVSVAVKTFTSVLIVACPCALAMSTPFTLGNTLRVFGNRKFYLKNSHVVEQLAKADTYIFDKTGTLTDPAAATVNYIGFCLDEENKSVIKGMVQHSMHALSSRINVWLGEIKPAYVEGIGELPGKGIEAIYNGKIVRIGSAKWLGIGNIRTKDFGNRIYISFDGEVKGYFHIQSGLRKGVERSMDQLKDMGQVHLLSGDQDHDRENLQKVFGAAVEMNFNQSPKEKLQYIKSLNDRGNKTVMVGDGLNDAGALQESRVGIAVTSQSTHFSPASDAIMDADVIGQLPQFIALAKESRNVIKASFVLSFLYNIVGISLAVQGLLSPVICAILMPLSSISVVVFTTVMINYLAMRKGSKNNYSWK